MPNSVLNPIEIFNSWYNDALECEHIKEANAASLATATKDGIPSNRIVLIKEFSQDGFVFYTNESSRKGQELSLNPVAAICYFWEPLNKQVRLEGSIEKISAIQADKYFNSRPLQSQIGAWASRQSQPLESCAVLLKNITKYTIRFKNKPPRPDFWLGYKLIPHTIEFWSRAEFRLHKRQVFKKHPDGWQDGFLYP